MFPSLVKRPFKSNGVVYPVGTVLTDSTGIKLYKSRFGEGKLVLVTERNLDQLVEFVKVRTGKDIGDELKEALSKVHAEKAEADAEAIAAAQKAEEERLAYIEKVKGFAEKFGVEMEGRELDDVVAEIREKQAAAKASTPE